MRWVALALIVLAGRSASAQTADSTAGLSLVDAVRTALRSSPTALTARQDVVAADGALMTARGQFDPQFTSSLLQSHLNQITTTVDPSSPLGWASAGTVTYDLNTPQLLRSGIIVTPDVSITRSTTSMADGFALSQAAFRLSALIPLWKDRGGAVTRTAERAAVYGVDASNASLRQGLAQSVLNAVSAYWAYREAQDLLVVFQSSEDRAQRMLADTKKLVDAEERTAADLTQARADLAAKRAARLSATQGVVQARQQLGLALGLDATSIAALAPAVTPYPALPADSAWAPPDSLGKDALARRGVYVAARAVEQQTQAQLSGARANLRGRVDLVVGLGYSGLAQGFGADRFVSSLYQNVRGLNATIQVKYQMPIGNSAARGREVQSEAALEQQRIARADIARRVTSSVAVAIEGLRNARLALMEAEEGATLFQQTVKNERRKFELGVSTLFEVIQAQDALTNAKVTKLDSQRTWALAIATVNFQAGTLVGGSGREASVDASRLLSPP